MRTLNGRLVGLLFLLAVVSGGRAVSAQTQTPAPTPAQTPKQTTAPNTTPTTAPTSAGAARASKSEAAVLDTPGGKLQGTLELPARGAGPFPVVLIISGSGPTDRDGNSPAFTGPNNSLKYLAEGLAAEGIASLRYDKRGIAASVAAGKAEADVRFDDYIEDAVLWGQRLRADKRFSALVVAGHSEGSLIGMVAAQRLGADGYVSVAGAGRRIDLVLLEQLKPRLPPAMYEQTVAVLKSLSEGKTVADYPPALASLFRPSVQPYFISWLKYDPAVEVAKLKAPALVAQGTHDLQVSVEDAKALAAASPGAKLLLVEGMNHVLKMTPADREQQIATYSDPALPVAPKFLAEFVAFVKGVRKK
jgi:pimeloyl-ACP methyl ester carboxylesterase